MNLELRHSGRTVFPGSSSHVANLSIYTANHTQFNTAMMDNTARPQLPTANTIHDNMYIPMMPNNAPGPQNVYERPPAAYMNQYYDIPSHNLPSSHGALYHNPVTGRSYSPAMHLNGNGTYSPQYISPSILYPFLCVLPIFVESEHEVWVWCGCSLKPVGWEKLCVVVGRKRVSIQSESQTIFSSSQAFRGFNLSQ
ncbi:hypothetical protein DEU56DRAFT_514964 [Suillus clintonianus]|uniref:uncharacterized protein n=1 Tax=Suillus clintonianus TaxID=1904413 RepID=UPI001B87DBE8|nr:uncharacterized protein DEU56DRAFT_514964 [Suillus clintonianus]KAG2152766.1 hypothetical protein DEU56DRAFT_514964 [Suillus clintonianus]